MQFIVVQRNQMDAIKEKFLAARAQTAHREEKPKNL